MTIPTDPHIKHTEASLESRLGYWNDTARSTSVFPTVSGDLNVDVAIVGGGIVGITTARMLKDQGLTVAVVESQRVGRQATGKSTAKVTSQHGLLYQQLIKKYDQTQARRYADAQQSGLMLIRHLIEKYQIECDLETLPAYIYTTDPAHVSELEREATLARQLGLPASVTNVSGLPFGVQAALRFEGQAQIHPVNFVAQLAHTLPGDGSHVFEQSPVISWEPQSVVTTGGTITASHVILATQLPLGLTGGYYTKAFPHAEPVIAARVASELDGMYLSAGSPLRSIRTHRNAQGDVYLLAAGDSFKPGETTAQRESFQALEAWISEHFGPMTVTHRWINEDFSAMDSVPFVGRSSRSGYLVATGFSGWGFTNGAAAAIMLRDIITGTRNDWQALFDADRINPVAGGTTFLKESAGVVSKLAKGYIKSSPVGSPDELAAGEAAVMQIDKKKVAAYRDETGTLHTLSAVCTHLGCVVGWNATDRTWDCPCHGSRFSLAGHVISGPAVKPLAPFKEED